MRGGQGDRDQRSKLEAGLGSWSQEMETSRKGGGTGEGGQKPRAQRTGNLNKGSKR